MPDTGAVRTVSAAPLAIILALTLVAASAFPAFSARPLSPSQDGGPVPPVSGLAGAEISDIVWSGRYLWVATEQGLARLDPELGDGLSQEHWLTFTQLNGLGQGAVSALDAVGDTVWVGTIFNESLGGQQVQVGDGLTYSHDGGLTWVHLANEEIFDSSRPGFERDTTPANNGCFGVAIDGATIWATFFAGSSMRSSDGGRSWDRVLPDGAETIIYGRPDVSADSLDILADSLLVAGAAEAAIAAARAGADSLRRQTSVHRTFSVLAYDDTVWIGTAGGLARSSDGGDSWKNSRVRVDADGVPLPGQISGEWVLSVERQQLPSGSTVVWAGTDVTQGPGQVAGINSTSDVGQTWRSGGPTFAWDFAFTDDSAVWASTNDGLFTTADQGRSWRQVEVTDPDTRNTLRGTFNGLASSLTSEGGETIWVGAENGIGRSADGGETWQILAFSLRTLAIDSGAIIGEVGLNDLEKSLTYAAPNPFDPSEGERAKFVYSLADEAAVTIDIFDFASRRVHRLLDAVPRTGGRNHGDSWDGRDDDGDVVANSVYFYRITTDGGDRAFGKVVILD
jgi:hypothetical protein